MVNKAYSFYDIMDLLMNLNETLLRPDSKIPFDEDTLALCQAITKDTLIADANKTSHKKFMFEKQLEDEAFAKQRFQDIIYSLKKLITKLTLDIDKDVASIENEMQGVRNYSEYEINRIENYIYKLNFREQLSLILGIMEDYTEQYTYTAYQEETTV